MESAAEAVSILQFPCFALSNMTVSMLVGTDAPVPPPEEADQYMEFQLWVVVATQYLVTPFVKVQLVLPRPFVELLAVIALSELQLLILIPVTVVEAGGEKSQAAPAPEIAKVIWLVVVPPRSVRVVVIVCGDPVDATK